MKNPSRFLVICLAVVLLIAAGVGIRQHLANKAVARKNGPVAVSLRLKWLNQAQFAGFYIAAQKGFYERRGLSVQIKPGGSEFPAIPDVAGGFDEFGVAGADQVLIARAQGAPITAV